MFARFRLLKAISAVLLMFVFNGSVLGQESPIGLEIPEGARAGAFEEFLFYDHPSGRNRVRMAMLWKSEHQDS